jgi:hypothetical protein
MPTVTAPRVPGLAVLAALTAFGAMADGAVAATGRRAAAHSALAAGGWRAPANGPVARSFDVGPNPYAGGQHRGADFAAAPGSAVTAACRGRVAVAGRVGASGRVVTLRCGRWRVTHMPLASVVVRAGDAVRAGQRIGTVAAGHGHRGVHLGVRHEGRRFGYVDPLTFLGGAAPSTPLAGRPRRSPSPRPPGPATPRLRPAPPIVHPARARGSSRVSAPARRVAARAPDGVAPWFVWAGTGLLLAGAVGAAGVRLAPRRRSRPVPRPAPQEVR